MAVIRTGLLGKSSGKVGPIITKQWKSLNVATAYFKPKNPKTPAQQAQRQRFSAAVNISRKVLTSLIKPIWDKLSNTQSGFNLFVSNCLQTMNEDNLLTVYTLVSKGTLNPVKNLQIEVGQNEISFSFNPNIVGNAKSSDDILIAIYDIEEHNFIYYQTFSNSRGNGVVSVNITNIPFTGPFIGYLFARQLTDTGYIYSDSLADTFYI